MKAHEIIKRERKGRKTGVEVRTGNLPSGGSLPFSEGTQSLALQGEERLGRQGESNDGMEPRAEGSRG